MLDKKYDSALIGLNYISLLKGIDFLRSGKSVLIIDDYKSSFGEQNYLNLSSLEMQLLRRITAVNDIDIFKNSSGYVTLKNNFIYIDNIFVEFSDSPFSNLKELARKFPRSFAKLFQNEFTQISAEKFDKDFMDLEREIAELCLASASHAEFVNIFLNKNLTLYPLFEKFYELLEKNEIEAKEIYYVLQMMFQSSFKDDASLLECSYLLISLLSTNFYLDEEKALNYLLAKFCKEGGHIKRTGVQDWGIKQGELKYLLLKSIDGLVEIGECYYFGRIKADQEFSLKRFDRTFLSLKLESTINHDFNSLYQDKRIVFLSRNKMGSDFPYWEISLDGKGCLEASFSYADNLGTKPSFYYNYALEEIYTSLLKIFPGISISDLRASSSVESGKDYWIEYKSLGGKSRPPLVCASELWDKDTGKKVSHLHYCGADRVSSLGFFGFLVELFDRFDEN